MSMADELLGSAPPRSLDSVQSGIERLIRRYTQDDDSESRQSNGFYANQITDARLRLLRSLRDWVAAGVRDEAALDARERDEAIDRERQAERR